MIPILCINAGRRADSFSARGNQHQPGSNGLVNFEEIGGDNSKVQMEPDSTEDHEGDVICCAFRHQVGGHKCVLQVTENLICKPCEESERIFYNNVPAILQPYVPGYRGEVSVYCKENGGHKTLHAKVSKSILRSCRTYADGNCEIEEGNWGKTRLNYCIKNESLWKNNSPEKFIMFDNLIANFERPCALDIKLCRYYHGMCSDPSKKLVLEQKCNNSTSSTLGFRIGGMQIYQHETRKMLQFNKHYGMSINDHQVIELLKIFFGRRSGTSIRDISNTIKNIHNAVLNQKDFIFLSVSLLFFYDIQETQHSVPLFQPEADLDAKGQNPAKAGCKVRLIDFEKVIPVSDEEEHLIPQHLKENINFGITNLSNILDGFAIENDLIKD